jgi:hypothetical protein
LTRRAARLNAATLNARAFAEHIKDADLRQQTTDWIAFMNARTLIKRSMLDEAEKIAMSDLRPELRVIIFSQIAAAWLARGDSVRGYQAVSTAEAQIEKSEDAAQRARLDLYLANELIKYDAGRARLNFSIKR